MNRERFCSLCGAKLNYLNPGKLCSPCQKRRLDEEAAEEEPNYNVEKMRLILGLNSQEQVRRLGRQGKIPGKVPGIQAQLFQKKVVDAWIQAQLFQKKVVDAWIQADYQIPRPFTDPLLQGALESCRRGDHSFFQDPRLDGHAYVKTTSSVGGPYVYNTCYWTTCNFCHFQEVSPLD